MLERELGRLQGRVELTEQTESTIREERDRLLEERNQERERAGRLEAELDRARLPWWRRWFA
jgi:chromosome segregation ATPase